ncbi:MAG: APC family permease [Staphylothermus sp.]|nr:APC family permease [Staphylothermus sp.]
MSDENSSKLVRTIGWITPAALVIGALGSSGIYGNLPYTYIVAGPGAIACWIITLLFGVILAMILAYAFTIWPDKAGAEYPIVHMALGEPWGTLTGIGWWISWGTTPAIVALILGRYIFGTDPSTYTMRQLFAFALVTVFFILNLFNIKVAGTAQNILSVLKVVPLIIVGAIGLAYINPANFSPFWKTGVEWIDTTRPEGMIMLFLAGALIASWSTYATDIFATVVPEMKDPHKNVVKSAVFLSVVCLAFIGLVSVSAVGVLGDGLGTLPRPLFTLGEIALGNVGYVLMFLALIAGVLGAINASLLGASRVLYQMAEDGLVPKAVTKLNRFHVPWIGVTITYLINVLMIAYTPLYIAIVTITMVPFLLNWTLGAFAAVKIRMTPEWHNKATYKASWPLIIAGAIVGVLNILFIIMYGLLYGWNDILIGTGFLIATIIYYIIVRIFYKGKTAQSQTS